jgi:hypothetical protein
MPESVGDTEVRYIGYGCEPNDGFWLRAVEVQSLDEYVVGLEVLMRNQAQRPAVVQGMRNLD